MLESCEINLFVQVVTKQGWRFPTSDFLSRALRHTATTSQRGSCQGQSRNLIAKTQSHDHNHGGRRHPPELRTRPSISFKASKPKNFPHAAVSVKKQTWQPDRKHLACIFPYKYGKLSSFTSWPRVGPKPTRQTMSIADFLNCHASTTLQVLSSHFATSSSKYEMLKQ